MDTIKIDDFNLGYKKGQKISEEDFEKSELNQLKHEIEIIKREMGISKDRDLQSNVEYDPKLQMQVPKEELESLKIENIILEQQLAQLKTEEAKVMLHRAISEAMIKARIDQYGYIPNPDPWRDLNG